MTFLRSSQIDPLIALREASGGESLLLRCRKHCLHTWKAMMVANWEIPDTQSPDLLETDQESEARMLASNPGLCGPRIVILEKTLAAKTPPFRIQGSNRLLLRVPSDWPGQHIDCQPPTPKQLADWAQSHALRAGVKLDRAAAGILVALGECLETELEKLICYCLRKGTATVQDAETICGSGGATQQAWALVDCLKKGGEAGAWSALERIFQSHPDPMEAALMVLHQVGFVLRKLVRAVHRRKAGLEAQAAFEQAGVEAWRMQQAAETIGFLRSRLWHVNDWIIELERHLKGGGGLGPRAACDLFLARLLGTS